MWQFPTPQKLPPLDIITFFLTQIFRPGRQVQHIRTDYRGKLARLSEFCTLLKNKFQILLEHTGTYYSWLNGRVGQHIQRACGMLRICIVDYGLGDNLWCCKCEYMTHKYNAIIHSAHGNSPDALLYGRKPCVWN